MIEEAAASRQVVIGAQRDPRTEIPKSPKSRNPKSRNPCRGWLVRVTNPSETCPKQMSNMRTLPAVARRDCPRTREIREIRDGVDCSRFEIIRDPRRG